MNAEFSWPFGSCYRSAYGKFSAQQATAVRPFLKGRVVHDLGCGNEFPLARTILRYGAKSVVGVDMRPLDRGTRLPVKATYVNETLSQYVPEDYEVAFLSWPVNYEVAGLVGLIMRAPVVVYLGCNFDTTSCGTTELYKHFVRRKLLAHVPHERNTLLVLGSVRHRSRKPTPEERAGIDRDNLFRFKDAVKS